MTFLCLGYPDRGFSPGPGLVAGHAARARRCGPRGSWPAAVGSAPAGRPSSSGSRTGEPTSATARRRAADRRARNPHHRDPRPRRPGSLVPTRPLTCVQASGPVLVYLSPRVNRYRFKPGGLAGWVPIFW